MKAMREAFRRDRWVVQVIAVDGLASPRILPLVEAVFAALADAGLDPAAARSAYLLLFQFTYGEALVTQHARGDSYAERTVSDLDPADPPAADRGVAPPLRRGPLRRQPHPRARRHPHPILTQARRCEDAEIVG